jgi:putative transcriptional regulator
MDRHPKFDCGRKGSGKSATGAKHVLQTIFVVFAALGCALIATPSAHAEGPTFLVATRNVLDPRFQESVILMLPVTQPPLVAGVIINKPTRVRVRDVFRDVPALKSRGEPAYFGGPVDVNVPSLFVRASDPPGKATRLFDDLYMSMDADSIAGILEHPGSAKDLRLFLGRAQWTLDQLHAEMLEGSWYIVPAKPAMVFSPDPEHLWPTLIQHAELEEVDATRPPRAEAFTLLLQEPDPIGTGNTGSGLSF